MAKRRKKKPLGRRYRGIPRTTYANMVSRCSNPKAPDFARYGGRGIGVCPDWVGPGGYKRFVDYILEALGPKPSAKHQLDRIDNDGNYEPGNLRWATRRQNANNKHNSRRVRYQGKTQTVTQHGRRLGMDDRQIVAVRMRLVRGWTAKRAFETPIKPRPLARHPKRKAIEE